ncbi:hypothetical protein MMC07_002832 [Pseudocyphellaria aurata]|nr:hypothetical protein [Pseudocyphellaria aurata]
MELLPLEIILHIASFLDVHDVLSLHLISRRFLDIGRDAKLWRQFCFQDFYVKFWEKQKDIETRTPVPIPEPRVFELQRIVARSITNTPRQDTSSRDPSGKQSSPKISRRRRSVANWDPSYPSEKVNWYEEYIARHAPLSISWLQQPLAKNKESIEPCEIRGVGLKNDGDERIVVAPLNDGGVCLWDIGRNDDVLNATNGRIMARTKPGILMSDVSKIDGSKATSSAKGNLAGPGVVECVSIDRIRDKAYFAVQNILNEVDLKTLQLTSHTKYPFTISALSETSYPTPLTVGTTRGLHLYDPRVSHENVARSQESERLDTIATFPSSLQMYNQLSKSQSPDRPLIIEPLFQPGPLCILHQPSLDGMHNSIDGDIYVAGRFPSILAYDRRRFPRPCHIFHSGARLCALASLDPTPGLPNPKSLLACGEYSGKGSLEVYPIPTLSNPDPSATCTKNRTSASSSKLLSVIPHGTRLLFSDGNGMIKWVERDGSTLVRRWNINQAPINGPQPPALPRRGLFSNDSGLDGGDVARKILSTGSGARDEVVVWTGERVGVVGFRKEPRFGLDALIGETKVLSIDEEQGELYGERMRRALERQADEVRFVRGLGLGV